MKNMLGKLFMVNPGENSTVIAGAFPYKKIFNTALTKNDKAQSAFSGRDIVNTNTHGRVQTSLSVYFEGVKGLKAI